MTAKSDYLPAIRLTLGFIADYCRVSRDTVLQWVRDNRLHAYSLPSGYYRISIENFRDFLESNNMPLDGSLFGSKPGKKGVATLSKGKEVHTPTQANGMP